MLHGLETVLSSLGPSAVAVSGGVDSMTLAALAHRLVGPDRVEMMHAVSPAVPPEATERVRIWADREGWNLRMLDAGEFGDARYLGNPVNRCFFCKTNLYATIASLTERQILSGANTDDLGEYRPGLDAARNQRVRHPYLEAAIDKRTIRELARNLGLGDVAELPSSPCLASRVQTTIPIDPDVLKAVHQIEILVGRHLAAKTVRCRVRRDGIVIELDREGLARILTMQRGELSGAIADLLPASLSGKSIGFELYRNGSAFVGAKS